MQANGLEKHKYAFFFPDSNFQGEASYNRFNTGGIIQP
jgi:hypothetical protein